MLGAPLSHRQVGFFCWCLEYLTRITPVWCTFHTVNYSQNSKILTIHWLDFVPPALLPSRNTQEKYQFVLFRLSFAPESNVVSSGFLAGKVQILLLLVCFPHHLAQNQNGLGWESLPLWSHIGVSVRGSFFFLGPGFVPFWAIIRVVKVGFPCVFWRLIGANRCCSLPFYCLFSHMLGH